MASRALLAIASTKPSPRMAIEARRERTSWPACTTSWKAALIARSLMSEPPGWSTKTPRCASKRPARSSVTWLVPPVTGDWWHSTQAWALNTGPRPSTPLLNSRSSKASSAASNSVVERKPLLLPSKDAGASVIGSDWVLTDWVLKDCVNAWGSARPASAHTEIGDGRVSLKTVSDPVNGGAIAGMSFCGTPSQGLGVFGSIAAGGITKCCAEGTPRSSGRL
jgi:hypothetical protein